LLLSEKRILTVSQLTGLLREVLEDNFAQVWVEGEVSNVAEPSSGHLYFTVKDAGAHLRCIMFRASAKALKFRPKDGMGVILRGRLSVYEQRGEYQLIADYLEPKGVGALQLAFIQRKEKLAQEGLFADEHKKQLPMLPQRIGIVTSTTGAAIHDILNVLNRRYTNVQVLILPVRVQGEGAADEIAAAIDDFNRYGSIDVLIVGRGGGSLEDLWAFNEEQVARAIHRSIIPVISAVGHEVDVTIADLVADVRAATPSAAAELVVKSKAEMSGMVESLSHRLVRAGRQRLTCHHNSLAILMRSLRDPSMILGHLGQRLDDLTDRLNYACTTVRANFKSHLSFLIRHLQMQNPALEVERCRERLVMLTGRMHFAVRMGIDRSHETMAVNAGKLHSLSPLHTLARGYAIVRKEGSSQVISDSQQVKGGDRLEVILHRGRLVCRAEPQE
jgi:exodeoxyribonuclease VII large subunit